MSKQKDLAARIVSNTEEQRIPETEVQGPPEPDPQQKRQMKAGLELQLAALRCRHCNSVGNWTIVKTTKVVRYIKCGACGRTSAIPVSDTVTKTLRQMDLTELEKKNRS